MFDDEPTVETRLPDEETTQTGVDFDDEPTRPDIRRDEIDGATAGADTPDHLIPEIDLPEGTVVSGGETPMVEADARGVFENTRTATPEREVAIVRNSETGERESFQGDNLSVDGTMNNPAMQEFMEGRAGEPGRWEVVEHSHPIDPTTRTTPEAWQYPSGQGGDFSVAHNESILGGNQPVERSISIVTGEGNQTVRYGFDPTNERPYWIGVPDEHGNPVTRFRSMEAYGEWYANRPGTNGASPHIEANAIHCCAERHGKHSNRRAHTDRGADTGR